MNPRELGKTTSQTPADARVGVSEVIKQGLAGAHRVMAAEEGIVKLSPRRAYNTAIQWAAVLGRTQAVWICSPQPAHAQLIGTLRWHTKL